MILPEERGGASEAAPAAVPRIKFLDGLRGLAAVQVVALHYVTAFFPAIGGISPAVPHPAWENWFIQSPLFFFIDGYLAVSLFFLISGMALTLAFRDGAAGFLAQSVRRLIRLGLPMAASVLLAACLFYLLPQAHVAAAVLLGNQGWLGAVGPVHVTVTSVAKEVFLGGMLFGHVGETLLPGPLGGWLGLPVFVQSFNAPLWTLHLEFYGSLLVLLLVRLERRIARRSHVCLCVALLVLLVAHPLDLFLIGYLCARRRQARAGRPVPPWGKCLGGLAIILGILLSAHRAPAGISAAFAGFANFTHLPMRLELFHAFGQYAGILIFFGVLALPILQRGLTAPVARLLGRYSFSLYLVHFPILFTVTSAMVVWTQHLGHGRAVLAVGSGLALTVLATIGFERWVDRPATVLSRRVGRRLSGPRRRVTAVPERAA